MDTKDDLISILGVGIAGALIYNHIKKDEKKVVVGGKKSKKSRKSRKSPKKSRNSRKSRKSKKTKCSLKCWSGYKRVPGKGCGKGSCKKI